jgi:citrate lyase subunit beta/citryl-CoA lyase
LQREEEGDMSVLRSLLFVPGNQARMLAKAMESRPDAFVPDLEDSVPSDEKANAREIVASHLPQFAKVGPLVIPRVNALDTGHCEDDLAAVVGPHIDGVSVGKIDTIQDVETLSGLLAELEKKADIPVGHVKLVLWIETAMAIVQCY